MATVVTNSVVDAINQVASNARVRLAMLMGAKLESGWNAAAVGDNGHSFGAFQINLPAHPNVSAASAKDPAFAARFMLPSYEAGVNRVDPAMWNSDPALAAAQAAFYAERPKVMYPIDRVRGSWGAVNGAWSGGAGAAGSALGLGDGTTTGGVDALTGNPIDAVGNGISELAKWSYWKAYDAFGNVVDKVFFGALIGGGALTVIVGFYMLLKNSTAVNAASSTASAYGSVIGALTKPVRRTPQEG
jgi:hypothetical protein